MPDFEIGINPKLDDFNHKLELEPRVILSAGFGDGKTYFLKRFSMRYKHAYHFFTIYPAQYVIGTNEVIFEYIKRDLLFQLVEKGVFTKRFDLVGMLKEIMDQVDITDVLSFFMSKPVARVLGNTIKQLESLRGEVDRHTLKASSYLNSFLSVKGGLYENDAYTCIIRKCFEKMRNEDNKLIVLVIEDLDRIDPGSIFSILNIFGSHFDRHYVIGGEEQENKFGVDKLITVMDYRNIQVLYNRYYGGKNGNNSFDGYISKYICSTPFYYSIRREAIEKLANKLFSDYGFTYADSVMKSRLRARMKEMSIRDLERLFYFDPNKSLRNPEQGIEINGNVLSPLSPIMRAQAYRRFFGIGFEPLEYEVMKTPKAITEIEFYGPLLLLKDTWEYNDSAQHIQYGEYFFVVKPKFDSKNRIITFYFRQTTSFATPILKVNEISGYKEWAEERLWEVEELFDPYFYYSPVHEGHADVDKEMIES